MTREQGRKASLWSYLKPLSDAVLVVLSFAIAYWVRYDRQWVRIVEPAYRVSFSVYTTSVLIMTTIIILVYWLENAYQWERGRTLFDELYIVFRGTLIGIALMIVVVFITMPNYYSRLIFGYTGIIILLLVSLSRFIEREVIARGRKHGRGVDRVLIVGAGEVARSIMRGVVARPELGYSIVGFVDDDLAKAQTDIGRYPNLGSLDDLPKLVTAHAVNEVIVTLPWMAYRKILTIISQCQREGVAVRIVPDMFQIALGNVVVETLNGVPLLGFREHEMKDWQIFIKRTMDVIGAGAALVLLSPLLLIVAIAIKLDSPGPAVFKQTRVGRNGTEFTVFKFRTMCTDAEAQVEALRQQNEASGPLFKIRNDPRCTRLGRLLRRTSVDEWPQFWNVLKGDMSLIGPRPALPSEVQEYAPWHRRRLEISPGITGLWQVSGRSDLTFDEMVLLDIYYIENWSPFMDLRISLKTIPTVLLGSGAY